MSSTCPLLHSAGCPATHRCDASEFIDSLNALVNGHINASRGEIEREVERAQELLRKHFEAKDAVGAVANGLHCNQSLDALLDANAESNAAVQRAVAAEEALTPPQPEPASSPLSEPSSPLSPVTSDDLAEALRRILDSTFAAPEVERAHNLLDRYDAQQSEVSKTERDESRDVWLQEYLINSSHSRQTHVWGQVLFVPEAGALGPYVRYVPYSHLVAAQRDSQQSESSKPARDESRDVWLPKFVLGESLKTKKPRTGRILPEANKEYSRLGFELYVPYSSIASEANKPALSEVEQAALTVCRVHSEANGVIQLAASMATSIPLLRNALIKRGVL